jgi:hypothetical protein
MVVYDRENLIKKFHNNTTPNNNQPSNVSIKSNHNGIMNNIDITHKKTKFQKCPSCCCFCFRKKPQENQSLRTSIPHYPYNNCPLIEQKQNGYLIYRFTNTSTTTTNNNNSNTNSPVHNRSTSSKTSLFCRPCKTSSKKQISNISDEIYQYRRNYLAHINTEYQFRNDDTPCYELKTFEKAVSPLIKCRSRSFEHSTASRIRDLNTELSRSRQLKAAAAAAAAAGVSTTTDSKNTRRHEVRLLKRLIFCSYSGLEKEKITTRPLAIIIVVTF